MAAQLRLGRDIGGFVCIRVQCEVLGYLPEEDLAVVSLQYLSCHMLTYFAIIGGGSNQ